MQNHPASLGHKIMETLPRVMQSLRLEMRSCAQNNLTVPQFRTLARIAKSPCTNKELAEWIGISAPAMSRMVDLLVKRGLISRASQEKDRREVTLDLTAKGKRFFYSIREEAKNKIDSRIKNMSLSDQAIVINALAILGEVFQNG